MEDSERLPDQLTRDDILEETGYKLALLFPRLPEESDDESSYQGELGRLKSEFGADNVIGRLVFEGAYGKVCQGIFVEKDAERSSRQKTT